ncbi:MAG: CRISPR-associated RAMP protein Csx7 [Elainellaceae cyanobacterium]
MFEIFKNRLDLTGTLTTVTALRISAGRSTDPLSVDLPVIKDVLNRPIIPGASFKGALRSRLESFVRAVHPDLAKDPSSLTEREMNDRVRRIKDDDRNQDDDARLTTALLDITDLVSQIFGTPWLAGKLQISDLTVLPDFWFGQYQERNGVAIDRDTETASGGKLYEFQVVPAGTPFQFAAVLENAENWELGLLLLGLNQFKTRQIPLGGARSRGLGVVELHVEKMLWNDMRSPNSQDIDRERVLRYIQQVATRSIQTLPGEDITHNEELHNAWVTALITQLRTSAEAVTA